MADKRFVLVTSTGCIEWAPARYKRDDIGIIRVRLTFKGVEYEEGPQLDPVKFYQEQETIENPKDNLPSTAIPNMEKVRKQFDELYEKGYRELIIIAISSGLGGTYNALRLVSEDYESKMKITVIDSRITAFNEGLLAIKAADLVKQGVPTEQIVKEIEWIKARQEFLGVDGKLDYLIYNGRLKGGKAFMGKMLNICPVIHFSPEGEVVPLASVRTQTKALHKTCEIIKKIIGDRAPKDYILFHVYTGPSAISELRDIEKEYGIECNHEDVIMSPVSGCHNGPWLAGYEFFPLRRADEPLE
ncbi:MAG: DegV family protein [Treponema sp.]|jgi:DegV family protein with EDD domain|nr:DegV family protein [Treponema sp.]